MSIESHKPCYANMFRDVLHIEKSTSGKVLSFARASLDLPREDRRVHMYLEEWDDCRECTEFDHCYKISLAKLLLQSTLSGD